MYLIPRKRKIQASINLAKEKLVQAAQATSDEAARIAEEEACNALATTPITFTFFEILAKYKTESSDAASALKPRQDYTPLSSQTKNLFTAINSNYTNYALALYGRPEAVEDFDTMLHHNVTFEVAMINPDYMLDDMPRNMDTLEDAQISHESIKKHLTDASNSNSDISMRYIERALIALAHTRITPEFLQTMKTAERYAAKQYEPKPDHYSSLLRSAALVHKDNADLSIIFDYLVNTHKTTCLHPENLSTLFNDDKVAGKRFRVSDIMEITQNNLGNLSL